MLNNTYIVCRGFNKPSEIEEFDEFIILRKNIKEHSNEDNCGTYQWKELRLTLNEYEEYKSEQSNIMLQTIMQTLNEIECKLDELL